MTALNVSGRSVSIGRYSLANMANNISSAVLPLAECPASKPFFNGSQCIGCPTHQYYDLRTLKCISARLVSNVAGLNATNRTLAIGHYTLSFIKKQIASLVLPVQLCPVNKPLYNGSQCVACPKNQYYLL